MEYSISQTEIVRRKKAYIALSVSLLFGLMVGSALFQLSLPIIFYLLTATFLVLLGVFSFFSFRQIAQLTFRFDDNALLKETLKANERYLLADIRGIKIDWTSNGTVREIGITLKDNTGFYITALKNFEKFKDELVGRVNKNIHIKESFEPINYDSFWFYPVLGLLLGTISVFGIERLLRLNSMEVKTCAVIYLLFSIGLAGYFFMAKPLSKRYGDKMIVADYLFGVSLLTLGGLVLLLSFFFIGQ